MVQDINAEDQELWMLIHEVMGSSGNICGWVIKIDPNHLCAVIEGLRRRKDLSGYEWLPAMLEAVQRFRQELDSILTPESANQMAAILMRKRNHDPQR